MHRSPMLVLCCLTAAAVLAGAPAPPPKPHTLAETERLVTADLAAHLKVTEADLTVRERQERRWLDAGLGCAARKGLLEPMPIDGYAFTVEHRGVRFEYHTDQHGRIRRCPSAKPVRPRG